MSSALSSRGSLTGDNSGVAPAGKTRRKRRSQREQVEDLIPDIIKILRDLAANKDVIMPELARLDGLSLAIKEQSDKLEQSAGGSQQDDNLLPATIANIEAALAECADVHAKINEAFIGINRQKLKAGTQLTKLAIVARKMGDNDDTPILKSVEMIRDAVAGFENDISRIRDSSENLRINNKAAIKALNRLKGMLSVESNWYAADTVPDDDSKKLGSGQSDQDSEIIDPAITGKEEVKNPEVTVVQETSQSPPTELNHIELVAKFVPTDSLTLVILNRSILYDEVKKVRSKLGSRCRLVYVYPRMTKIVFLVGFECDEKFAAELIGENPNNLSVDIYKSIEDFGCGARYGFEQEVYNILSR